jgi:hypothetical protein
VTEPEACYGPAISASRITQLVYCELALGTTRLTDHREALQFSRIWVYGRYSLGGLSSGDSCRLFLLFVQFAYVGCGEFAGQEVGLA